MPYTTRETAELVVTFDDASGQLYDVDSLTLRLRPPAGVDQVFSLAEATIAHVGLGTYRARAVLAVAGVWIYEWVGMRGELAAVDSGAIRVVPGPFGT